MASLVKYVIEKLGKENFHFFSIALFSKVWTFWEAHMIWKNLPYGFDVY